MGTTQFFLLLLSKDLFWCTSRYHRRIYLSVDMMSSRAIGNSHLNLNIMSSVYFSFLKIRLDSFSNQTWKWKKRSKKILKVCLFCFVFIFENFSEENLLAWTHFSVPERLFIFRNRTLSVRLSVFSFLCLLSYLSFWSYLVQIK